LLGPSKKHAYLLLNVSRELPGWASYLPTGATPHRIPQGMRRLLYLSDRRFNDAFPARNGWTG